MRLTSCLVVGLFVAAANFSWAVGNYEPRSPDQTVTPGDLCSPADRDFSYYRYSEQIAYCIRNVTPAQKAHIYELYKIPLSRRQYYTIDHFIPLSIGGNNSPLNLWPEHRKIKKLRQDLELNTFHELDRGEITQKEAIERIVEAKLNPPLNWTEGVEEQAKLN